MCSSASFDDLRAKIMDASEEELNAAIGSLASAHKDRLKLLLMPEFQNKGRPDDDRKALLIKVNLLSGDVLEFDVGPDETIKSLRRRLAAKWKCKPWDVQVLAGEDVQPQAALLCDIGLEYSAVVLKSRAWDTSITIPKDLKIVVVGDDGIGKTSLIIRHCTDEFPVEYIPTVFDNSTVEWVKEDIGTSSLGLWDVAGAQDYDRLRPLSYPGTGVFLLCFSLTNRASFENVAARWDPELRHHCPGVKVILVGLQSDMRDRCSESAPSLEDACDMVDRIGAADYVECSALTGEGIPEVFDTSVLVSSVVGEAGSI